MVESVIGRLRELGAEDESPWIKIGDVVVRASSIEDDGRTMSVAVATRHGEVLGALEAMRPDTWQRTAEVPVAFTDRAGTARVTEVHSRTFSSTRRELTLTADVTWADGRRPSLATGINGIAFEEQIELGLRAGLFGEALPERLGIVSSLVDSSDPLAALDGLGLPHSTFEAVARLLLVERLLGAGGASGIEHVAVGPEHQRARRIEVAWRDAIWARDVDPARRAISGARLAGSLST